MDDHMLDRIWEDVELCFMLCKYEEDNGNDYRENINYKTASVLISTYNKLVKLYYREEYLNEFLKGNVAVEYKEYAEWN